MEFAKDSRKMIRVREEWAFPDKGILINHHKYIYIIDIIVPLIFHEYPIKSLAKCPMHEKLPGRQDLLYYFIDTEHWVPVSVLLMDKSRWG